MADSVSAATADELAALLKDRKLDAIAARDPAQPDRFVAALFFADNQLLVVAGRYPAPSLLDAKLTNRQYREIYVDLQGTSIADDKVFFQDLGADGLHDDSGEAVDVMYQGGTKQTIFNGRDRKATQKTFVEADGKYARLLSLLVRELRSLS